MVSGIGRRREAAQKDTTNESYQRRRQEIFDAAGHVFKTKGFQGASLGDIADYLGTDRANLYYYVASKEEILDGVVSRPVLDNAKRAKEIAASDLPTPEKLRTLIVELMVSYEKNFPFLYVFIQENLSQISGADPEWTQEMRKANRDYEEAVVQIVEAGHADGTVKNTGPAWVVAYGIIGLVAWTNRWYDPKKSKVDAVAIGTAYADMVISGIATPAGVELLGGVGTTD